MNNTTNNRIMIILYKIKLFCSPFIKCLTYNKYEDIEDKDYSL